jgi:hypothetical protein
MLASSPASILNQNCPDLGIPNRFIPIESHSKVESAGNTPPVAKITAIRRRTRPAAIAGGPVVLFVREAILNGKDVCIPLTRSWE